MNCTTKLWNRANGNEAEVILITFFELKIIEVKKEEKKKETSNPNSKDLEPNSDPVIHYVTLCKII